MKCLREFPYPPRDRCPCDRPTLSRDIPQAPKVIDPLLLLTAIFVHPLLNTVSTGLRQLIISFTPVLAIWIWAYLGIGWV